MDLPKGKPILSLDFDGVIHSYESGWKGASIIPDPVVPGAIEFIVKAKEHFEINVFSSRSHQWGGKRAMKKWLISQMEDYYFRKDRDLAMTENPFIDSEMIGTSMAKDFVDTIKFPKHKPAAFLSIDDRGYCFKGEFPDPESLLNFKPWNKK